MNRDLTGLANLAVEGDLQEYYGDAYFDQNLTVEGVTNLNGSTNIVGGLTASGAISASSCTLSGALTAGATTVSGLTVNGTTNINSSVIANSATITPLELSYLDGATSNLQTQINSLSSSVTNLQTQQGGYFLVYGEWFGVWTPNAVISLGMGMTGATGNSGIILPPSCTLLTMYVSSTGAMTSDTAVVVKNRSGGTTWYTMTYANGATSQTDSPNIAFTNSNTIQLRFGSTGGWSGSIRLTVSLVFASNGVVGQTGADGKSLVIKGTYSSTTTYTNLDVVSYNNGSYVCKVTSSLNVVPTNTTNWMQIAAQGATGSTGATPSFSIGSVSSLPAGSTPVVTITGSSASPQLNFQLPAGNTGQQGIAGPAGATGATPTISVGTVTSLPAGSSPYVTQTGTTTAPVLNFGLVSGQDGKGLNPRGEYSAYATYNRLDLVKSNGSSYCCLQDGIMNVSVSNALFWQLICEKGDAGESIKGDKGDKGEKGDAGTSIASDIMSGLALAFSIGATGISAWSALVSTVGNIGDSISSLNNTADDLRDSINDVNNNVRYFSASSVPTPTETCTADLKVSNAIYTVHHMDTAGNYECINSIKITPTTDNTVFSVDNTGRVDCTEMVSDTVTGSNVNASIKLDTPIVSTNTLVSSSINADLVIDNLESTLPGTYPNIRIGETYCGNVLLGGSGPTSTGNWVTVKSKLATDSIQNAVVGNDLTIDTKDNTSEINIGSMAASSINMGSSTCPVVVSSDSIFVSRFVRGDVIQNATADGDIFIDNRESTRTDSSIYIGTNNSKRVVIGGPQCKIFLYDGNSYTSVNQVPVNGLGGPYRVNPFQYYG